MQTFLQAVGFTDSPRTIAKQVAGLALPSVVSTNCIEDVEEPLVPDLITVAAATEKSIIALEEKAKRLGQMKMQEACSLVAEWIQGLKRRPRTDEPLASFKASFLRSNALEKSLENLRQGKSTESRLAADMTTLLQLCIPKGASALAKPLLHVVVGDEVPSECATALLIAIQTLKEDWQEVVWSQVIRLLERQLNSIEYELDKAKAHSVESTTNSEFPERIPTEHEQELSRDKVAIIASLCEVISKSRQQTQSRAKEVSKHLKQLGVDLSRWLGCSPRENAALQTPLPAVPSERESTTPRHAFESAVNGSAEVDSCSASPLGAEVHKPSWGDCELAFESMMGKDTDGMRKGLQLLGFPDLPLQYEPGVELRLDGHDIRDVINRILAHWSVGEVDEFNQVLAEVRKIFDGASIGGATVVEASGSNSPCSLPPHELKQDLNMSIEAMEAASQMPESEDHHCRLSSSSPGCALGRGEDAIPIACQHVLDLDIPQLLAERADIVEQRQVLIERLEKDLQCLRELDKKLAQVDTHLGQNVPAELKHSESFGVADRIANEFSPCQPTSTIPRDLTDPDQSSGTCVALPPHASASFSTPRASKSDVKELLDVLDSASEALELEFQRSVEKFTTSLQQKRAKLLEALHIFFKSGVQLVESMATDTKRGETFEDLWLKAQELCVSVDAAVDGRSRTSAISLHSPEIGARCLAKWAGDGDLYDAEVRGLGDDGTVVVNWLRPRPDSLSDTSPSKSVPCRPMRTITAQGGDDLTHRWVAQEDIHILEASDPKNTRAVQSFLDSRSPEDRKCVDCGGCEAQWASISYATYMCESCRLAVVRDGVQFPLLSTSDAWSWSEDDLAYMRSGGNSEYLGALANFPDLANAPIHIRYSTRFAEYYRRRIEVLAHDLPAPPLPPADTVASETKHFPKASPDFLCEPEARMYVCIVVQNFARWACEKRRTLPKPRVKVAPERISTKAGYSATKLGRQPLVVEGCGSAAARSSHFDRRSM